MKKFISLILTIISINNITFSQESSPKTLISEIANVTVFLNGAEITRKAKTTLPIGQNEVVFTGLSQHINPQSIQIKSENSLQIMGVEHSINYTMPKEKSKEIEDLTKQIELLNEKLSSEQIRVETCNEEEKLLQDNRNMSGKEKAAPVSELKLASDFYRERFIDIKSKRIEANKKIKNLQEEIAKLNNQLKQLQGTPQQPVSEIKIRSLCQTAGTYTFQLSYYVYNVSWSAQYDIRVENTSKPATIVYKAAINQQSGEDWKNVALTLSTGNPSISGTKPELNNWYLDYYQPQTNRNLKKATMYEGAAPAAAPMALMQDMVQEEKLVSSSMKFAVNEQVANYVYTINTPYTIPSSGKEFMVNINDYEAPALYEYQCVPKLDGDVFLIARIVNNLQYQLLSGTANLYFEGTYVGNSFLNAAQVSDTLNISLGRDKNIVVKREVIKDFTSTQFLGDRKKIQKGWKIEVRNNRKNDIKLTIEDQYPLSRNKEIEIERIENTGATVNIETGKITWKLSLKPSEQKSITFKYQVKYPKDANINLY